jgi:3'-5' exoribonuclease
MGPRLPGDKGPAARADKPRSLTHNPFAALAARVEGSAEPPAEAAPGAPPEEPAAPSPAPAPATQATETGAAPAEAAPPPGGEGSAPN